MGSLKRAAGVTALAAALAMSAGCFRALFPGGKGSHGGAVGGAAGTTPGGNGGNGGGGGGASGANGGGAGGNGSACNGPDTLAGKRLVRLSQAQVVKSIRALLGDAVAGAAVTPGIEVVDGIDRTVPQLDNPREGSSINETLWRADDLIASNAARAVLDGFAGITGCGDAPTADCGRGFLLDFAARAYRRPLSPDELQSLTTVYDETRGLLGNVPEAVQFGVNAVLEAPEFLYRSELGDDGHAAGALTPHELASALSYFVTDGPPDQALLAAAAAGHLTTASEIAAQVDRLLATDAARRNLEDVMLSQWRLADLDRVVFDVAAVPGIGPYIGEAGRRSMRGGMTRFVHERMWGGPLADLLTSNRTWVDATLAGLYGVDFPPPGAALDSEGFAAVDLPNGRAGLLTEAAFLTAMSRPTAASLILRGVRVRALAACADRLPAVAQPDPSQIVPLQGTAREQAEMRMAMPACGACHRDIDPYAIPLESFDLIGRYRIVDEQRQPIVTSATLPPSGGGAAIADTAAMARELTRDDRFAACLTQQFFGYALADSASSDLPRPGSCVNRGVVHSLAGAGTGPPRFADVVRGIATSPAFRARRLAGGAP